MIFTGFVRRTVTFGNLWFFHLSRRTTVIQVLLVQIIFERYYHQIIVMGTLIKISEDLKLDLLFVSFICFELKQRKWEWSAGDRPLLSMISQLLSSRSLTISVWPLRQAYCIGVCSWRPPAACINGNIDIVNSLLKCNSSVNLFDINILLYILLVQMGIQMLYRFYSSRFKTFMSIARFKRSDNQSQFKLKNNIGEGMKMFRKFLTFCLKTLFWQMYWMTCLFHCLRLHTFFVFVNIFLPFWCMFYIDGCS
jgi:hypothetical protein